jgi:hypothetical protein
MPAKALKQRQKYTTCLPSKPRLPGTIKRVVQAYTVEVSQKAVKRIEKIENDICQIDARVIGVITKMDKVRRDLEDVLRNARKREKIMELANERISV